MYRHIAPPWPSQDINKHESVEAMQGDGEEKGSSRETDRLRDNVRQAERRNILLEPALYACTFCHWGFTAAINIAWMHLSKDNAELNYLWVREGKAC